MTSKTDKRSPDSRVEFVGTSTTPTANVDSTPPTPPTTPTQDDSSEPSYILSEPEAAILANPDFESTHHDYIQAMIDGRV